MKQTRACLKFFVAVLLKTFVQMLTPDEAEPPLIYAAS